MIQRFLFFSVFLILMNFRISGFGQEPGQLNILSFDIEKLLPPLSKIIDTALKINPGLAEARYGAGVALYNQGKMEEAAAGFREALRLKPDYADAQNNLRALSSRIGQTR